MTTSSTRRPPTALVAMVALVIAGVFAMGAINPPGDPEPVWLDLLSGGVLAVLLAGVVVSPSRPRLGKALSLVAAVVWAAGLIAMHV